jgi:hypothetical protein
LERKKKKRKKNPIGDPTPPPSPQKENMLLQIIKNTIKIMGKKKFGKKLPHLIKLIFLIRGIL